MVTQPNIIVTRNDLERLEELLSSAAAKGLPGVDSLWQELERAEVVSAKDVPPGVVTMNSTVQFVEEGTGKTHEMTLVYPHEIDGTPGKVSILAPVGSALLGLSEGQTIEWSRPGGGTIKLRVVRVLYQPEASASSAQA
ncbi:MAG: nucleoside diphosphate kinase regulator [Xanthomonadaceae bacterium]|nr:nucleoside diphosphate kinase regulator [Xanthomonadaceae bacterium]